MTRLGQAVVRGRRWVFAAFLAGFVAAAALGGSVADDLSVGGIFDPDAESSEAARVLEERFQGGDPNLILLVTAREGTVDDPEVAEAGVALTRRLAEEEGILFASSYWSAGAPSALRSRDGDKAIVAARIAGGEDEVAERVTEIAPEYRGEHDLLTVGVGGQAEVLEQIGTQVEEDLRSAELVAFAVTLVLLLLVFRSVVASALPLVLGALAVVATLPLLGLIAAFTDVSVFALNLTAALGLGLAIDYGLLMVSRFREERRAGLEPGDAVVRTVETAGRTVLFSALTIALALTALLLFPMYYLRSMAYGGIGVVLLAAVSALVLLPALLASLGDRVNWGMVLRRRRSELGDASPVWRQVATAVTRRPLVVCASVAVLLLAMGSPFLGVELATSDDRVLPDSAPARQVHETLRAEFDGDEASQLSVVAPAADPHDSGRIDAYAARLSELAHVGRVDALSGSYVDGTQVEPPDRTSMRFAAANGDSGAWFSVAPEPGRSMTTLESLVRDVRGEESPWPVMVSGEAAQLVDVKEAIADRLPFAVGLIVLVTFTLLFLMTGSVVAPAKAIVTNLLGLSAAFGVIVLIFQEGFLSGPLDFAPGPLEVTTPILLFCVAFGLAIDYEVFLLSRMKEEYDRTGDTATALITGVERTGRIITASALLLSVVFLSVATSQVTFIKMFGIGLTIAVMTDAVLVRTALVPSFMLLAGDANWWCPRWLRRAVIDRLPRAERGVEPAEEPRPEARVP